MKASDFIKKLHEIVESKTVYMWGASGQRVAEAFIAQKSRQYPSWYTAAKQAQLRALIGKGYEGWDCSGLIKAVIWGWPATKYASNGLPDTNSLGLINRCKDVSTDFSNIEPGELLWMQGHVGIYIGDGDVIEATPSWANGVQITKLSARRWLKHGKMPELDYSPVLPEEVIIMRTTANLNLRSGAGTNHSIILTMAKGSEVQLLLRVGTWARLSYRGLVGWAHTDYLETVPVRRGGKVLAYTLNVRSGPGTAYRVMGTLSKDAPVEIIKTEKGWHNIRYGTVTAWVSADWIEEAEGTVDFPNQRGRVVNCYSLNVRQSPGGRVIGGLRAGDLVTIIGKEGSWYELLPEGMVHSNYVELL